MSPCLLQCMVLGESIPFIMRSPEDAFWSSSGVIKLVSKFMICLLVNKTSVQVQSIIIVT